MSDHLFLVCELAVAFAGFTAIVSALDTRFHSGHRRLDIERLRQMLEMSLATIGGGLLPSILALLEVPEPRRWQVSALMMLLVSFGLLAIQVPRGFRQGLRKTPEYSVVYARSLVAIGIGTAASFTVAVFGVRGAAGPYTLGVTLMLMIASLQFFRAATSFLLERSGDGSS